MGGAPSRQKLRTLEAIATRVEAIAIGSKKLQVTPTIPAVWVTPRLTTVPLGFRTGSTEETEETSGHRWDFMWTPTMADAGLLEGSDLDFRVEFSHLKHVETTEIQWFQDVSICVNRWFEQDVVSLCEVGFLEWVWGAEVC